MYDVLDESLRRAEINHNITYGRWRIFFVNHRENSKGLPRLKCVPFLAARVHGWRRILYPRGGSTLTWLQGPAVVNGVNSVKQLGLELEPRMKHGGGGCLPIWCWKLQLLAIKSNTLEGGLIGTSVFILQKDKAPGYTSRHHWLKILHTRAHIWPL